MSGDGRRRSPRFTSGTEIAGDSSSKVRLATSPRRWCADSHAEVARLKGAGRAARCADPQPAPPVVSQRRTQRCPFPPGQRRRSARLRAPTSWASTPVRSTSSAPIFAKQRPLPPPPWTSSRPLLRIESRVKHAVGDQALEQRSQAAHADAVAHIVDWRNRSLGAATSAFRREAEALEASGRMVQVDARLLVVRVAPYALLLLERGAWSRSGQMSWMEGACGSITVPRQPPASTMATTAAMPPERARRA